MSLTPAQIRAALTPLVRRLRGAYAVAGFGAAGDNLGYVTVTAPNGAAVQVTLAVDVLTLTPLEPFLAAVQDALRAALRPFEGECGRGFDKAGRGALAVGSAGFSARDGWV